MNPSRIPSVRFKGYEDEWEERKSKDLFTPINERNREDLPVLSVTQDQGVVLRNDLAIDIKYDKSTLSSYKVIHPGDFVISLRSFQGGFELSKVLGISSPAYTIFDLKNLTAHNKLYWKYIFKSFKFIESLKTVTFGIRDGKSISFREFSDLKINYPSDASEQEKIGSFFQQLDETIDLHQRKLDLLKEQKKGYLQKMFPKNGAKVPELRFAGFTDAWEERKLGDYVIIRSGWSPSNFDINNNANNLFIKVDDLNYSTRVQEESQVKVNILSKYKKMKKSSTIFPKRGAAIMTNKVRMLGEDSYMDTNMMALEPKGIDPEYLYTFINKTGLYKIADTSTIPQINNKHIEPYLLLIPSLEEQQKIGSFFKQLDDTIILHQRKIDELKLMKKSMLQKMFV